MALINSKDYEWLSEYSLSASEKRGIGRFYNLSITGTKRPGEEIGKMQIRPIGGDNHSIVMGNLTNVTIIPVLMKQMRENVITVKEQNGSAREKTVCFSFDGNTGSVSSSGLICPEPSKRETANNGKCKNCKLFWIITGQVIDSKGKPVRIKNPETDKEDNLYIYTKNSRSKASSIFDLQFDLSEKMKELTPLTDNPDLEKSLAIKRFIIDITVDYKSVPNRPTMVSVFKYTIVKQIPDATVLKLLKEDAKLIDDFNKQFNKMAYVARSNYMTTNDNVVKEFDEPLSEPEEEKSTPDTKYEKKEVENKSDEKDQDDVPDIDLGF